MRKLGAFLVVAVAATLLGTTALAGAHARARNHHAVKYEYRHMTVHHQRITIISHIIHDVKAHFATTSCPPGSTSGGYCTPPNNVGIFSVLSAPGPASISVTTSSPNTLLVAFVMAQGPSSGGQTVTSVSGGGLTWTKVASENAAGGDSEVWDAMAAKTISKQKITATASITGYDVGMTIAAFTNAPGIGASGVFDNKTGSATTGTIKTTYPDTWVWGGANDPKNDVQRGVPSGQNAWVQQLAQSNSNKSTFWTQSTTNPSTGPAGTPVTINDTSPTNDPWNLVLVEIL